MIEVHRIEVHSSTYVAIRYLRDGNARCLDLEYDDAGELLDAITDNPEAASYYARLAIRHEEANA